MTSRFSERILTAQEQGKKMRFSRRIAIPAIFCIFFVSSSPSTANGFLDTLMEDVTEAVETAKESIEWALPGLPTPSTSCCRVLYPGRWCTY